MLDLRHSAAVGREIRVVQRGQQVGTYIAYLRGVPAEAPEDIFEMAALELKQPRLDHGCGPVLLADADVIPRGADRFNHQLYDVVYNPGVNDALLADVVRFEILSNNLTPNPFIFYSLRRRNGMN